MLPETGHLRAAQGSSGQEDQGASPGHGSDDQHSHTTVTHFAPEKLRPDLEHTTSVFPLAFTLFETFLGSRFPLRQFHQASKNTRAKQ